MHAGVQLGQIVRGAVAVLRHDGADEQATLRRVIGGQPHQLPVHGIQQIVPGAGCGDAHAVQHIVIDHDAQGIDVDSAVVAVVVFGGAEVGGRRRGVGHQFALLGQGAAEGLVAAIPHVGAAAAGQTAGLHCADGDVDAEQLLELLAGGGHKRLVAGYADGQAPLLAGRVDLVLQPREGGRIGGGHVAAAVAAGAQAQAQ